MTVNRPLILLTMMIGTFMAALDGSIVNISLPPMAEEFHASLTEIEWVVLAYMIAFAVGIPLTNWLRERLGFRVLYTGSLSIFVLGSVMCGLSNGLEQLVISRVVQAIGGGMLTPTAMAILSTVFPAHERGRAIGLWGLGVVLGPTVGPTIGGLLTAKFGWPAIFWINLPVGLLGIILSFKVLRIPVLEKRSRPPLDLVGFLFLNIFLVSLLLAVTGLEKANPGGRALLLWLLSFSSLGIFIFTSLRSRYPILDLRIFLNRDFTACSLVTVARSAGLHGGIFLLPFLMQTLLGFSEIKSGLLMLPGSLLVALLMPLSGRWTDRHGPRGIVVTGLLLVSVSLAVFGIVPIYATLLMILAAMVLRGVGLGLLVIPISTATVNVVRPSQVTMASSMGSLLQQCGGALGVSIFALIHQAAFLRAGTQGRDFRSAESYALQLSFFTTGAAMLLALLPAVKLPKSVPARHEVAEVLIE